MIFSGPQITPEYDTKVTSPRYLVQFAKLVEHRFRRETRQARPLDSGAWSGRLQYDGCRGGWPVAKRAVRTNLVV